MPVDPAQALAGGAGTFSVGGAEWRIDPIAAPAEAGEQGGGGFGDMLASSVGKLSGMQQEAAEASRGLVDGSATDVSQVVMSVERARLAMQLASQIRTKGVEAYQDVFHTQV